MRLLLLRHAKAEKADPALLDRDRALSLRGRRDAQGIGTYLVRHKLLPDHTIVSSARRTRETWDHLKAGARERCTGTLEDRLYNASRDAILRLVREIPGVVSSAMVIGHNPSMHECAMALIAAGDVEARERLNEGLPTSGLVVIDFSVDAWSKVHPQRGRLERFVTPSLLKLRAD